MSFKEWLNEDEEGLRKSLPKIKGWDVDTDGEWGFTYSKTDSGTGLSIDIGFEDVKGNNDFVNGKITYNVQSDDPMERSALVSTTVSRKLRDLKDVKNAVKFVLNLAKKKYNGLKTMKF